MKKRGTKTQERCPKSSLVNWKAKKTKISRKPRRQTRKREAIRVSKTCKTPKNLAKNLLTSVREHKRNSRVTSKSKRQALFFSPVKRICHQERRLANFLAWTTTSERVSSSITTRTPYLRWPIEPCTWTESESADNTTTSTLTSECNSCWWHSIAEKSRLMNLLTPNRTSSHGLRNTNEIL